MRRFMRLVLLAAIVFATLPGTPASGGNRFSPALSTALQEDFGLNGHQSDRWTDALVPVGDDFSAFGFGGNAEVPATVTEDEAPWTTPIAFGVNIIQFQSADTIPDFGTGFGLNGDRFSGSVNGGIQPRTPYLVGTAIVDGDVPVDEASMDLFQQWDFVLNIPGLDPWVALPDFPDDTWNLGTFVMSLVYGPNPWSLNFHTFQNGQILDNPLSGFALIHGNVVMVGVEARPEIVGTGDFLDDIQGRLALDVKDSARNPGRSRVVVAPRVPLGPGSFFPYMFSGGTFVPGLPPELDIIDVWPMVGPDGNYWFNLMPAGPWVEPPSGYFSNFVQVSIQDPRGPNTFDFVGFQTHDGVDELFAGNEDGPITGLEGFVTTQGNVVLQTGLPATDGPLEFQSNSGMLLDEDGDFLDAPPAVHGYGPGEVPIDDPETHDGGQPAYDLRTGTPIVIATTTTTTQPSVVTETTQPAASGATTTTTTRPATTTVVEEPSLLTIAGPGSATCWWCWGAAGALGIALLGILFLWLKPEPWWSCWAAWFIVIFVWVPFLLAGLEFFRPDWWWAPLLAWFPLIGGYTWGWGQKQLWWKPWMLGGSAGYLVLLAVLMLVVGEAGWGMTLPAFWLPLVAFYLGVRGRTQPWFQPWMWGLFAAYVGWVFVWVAALTPWWAWWLPAVYAPVAGWRMHDEGLSPREALVSRKWCWVTPFTLLPFLGWWCVLWGPWWGYVVLAVLALVLLGAIFLWLKPEPWWSCWLAWFIVIFVWVPLLLTGLSFFRPDWWWAPLLAWFPLIGGYTWGWGQKQLWWKPWMLGGVGAYLAVLAASMLVVKDPEWGLLLPVFWLPLVALYLGVRGRTQPWFQPWMWGLFAAYVGWVFLWAGALTPGWAWAMPAALWPFAYIWHHHCGPGFGLPVKRMWSWALPFAAAPLLAFMLALYAVPDFYERLPL